MVSYVIGRRDVSQDSHGRAHQAHVSRRHLRVFRLAGGRFRIEDLGSANGTFVRRASKWLRVYLHEVAADDAIMLGRYKTTIGALLTGKHMEHLQPADRRRNDVAQRHRSPEPPKAAAQKLAAKPLRQAPDPNHANPGIRMPKLRPPEPAAPAEVDESVDAGSLGAVADASSIAASDDEQYVDVSQIEVPEDTGGGAIWDWLDD